MKGGELAGASAAGGKVAGAGASGDCKFSVGISAAAGFDSAVEGGARMPKSRPPKRSRFALVKLSALQKPQAAVPAHKFAR